MATRKALALRNRNSMLHVSTLMKVEAKKVVAQGSNLGQQDFGGFLRTVVPAIVSRYGGLNASVAADYYDTVRQDFAKSSKPYKAILPTFDATGRSLTLVNYGMASFMKTGFDSVMELLPEAMTYTVADYNRETIAYNARSDSGSKTVQRIAEPGACAFCALLAFSTTSSAEGEAIGTRTFSYAPDFHNNCHCTVEVVFEGEDPIVPDYYADFAQEYADAQGGSAQEVLAKMRANTGRA